MARGKHGQAAQAKADDAALTRIREVEKELGEERAAHDRTRQELQLARTRSASELLAAKREAAEAATETLQSNLDFAVGEIRKLEDANQKVRDSHDKLFHKVVDHFLEAHGWTGGDAVQRIAEMLGAKGLIVDDTVRKSGMPPELAYRLEVARGIRSGKTGLADEGGFNTDKRPW